MGVKIRILKFLKSWLPAIAWAALIFKLSSGTVPVTSPIYWQDFAAKKTAHMVFYAILAIFVYRGFRNERMERKKAAIWSVIIATFYGATDEYHQSFTQVREARIRDVGFDGIGASIAAFLIYRYLSEFPKNLRSFLVKLGLT